MGRDVLWFFVAVMGVSIVVALSNVGSGSATNAVLTLSVGGGFRQEIWDTYRWNNRRHLHMHDREGHPRLCSRHWDRLQNM